MLDKIRQFLQAAGMSQTQFGYECMGDPAFVKRLEEGRVPRPKTVAKIEKFIENRSPE